MKLKSEKGEIEVKLKSFDEADEKVFLDALELKKGALVSVKDKGVIREGEVVGVEHLPDGTLKGEVAFPIHEPPKKMDVMFDLEAERVSTEVDDKVLVADSLKEIMEHADKVKEVLTDTLARISASDSSKLKQVYLTTASNVIEISKILGIPKEMIGLGGVEEKPAEEEKPKASEEAIEETVRFIRGE